MPRPMTRREGAAMDRYITGNYGEDQLLVICPDCGSADTVREDRLYDCLACGCYFDPEHPDVQAAQQGRRLTDKSEQFDRAFSKDDPTMATLKRILGCFDLDMFYDMRRGQETYTVRLWEEGEVVAESSGEDLENVLRDIDTSAAAIANYG